MHLCMCVAICDGCSCVFSNPQSVLIFKPVLIYCTCNLYKVVKICHKFSMPTVIHCNSVLETHCAKGDGYIVFLSPVVAMVMMNRLESGDTVRGRCS